MPRDEIERIQDYLTEHPRCSLQLYAIFSGTFEPFVVLVHRNTHQTYTVRTRLQLLQAVDHADKNRFRSSAVD